MSTGIDPFTTVNQDKEITFVIWPIPHTKTGAKVDGIQRSGENGIQEERRMIENNNTWELVEKPAHKDAIGVKWVSKFNPDGSIQKYKALLVVKGYTQQYWVDDNETFAPVSRQERVRAILALAAQKGWKVYQLDVKSAFNNGHLQEDKATPWIHCEKTRKESPQVKLKKALYGLLQAPRAWYSKVDSDFLSQGFRRSCSEPTLYIKCQSTSEILILELYVDDLIVTGSNAASILFHLSSKIWWAAFRW